MREIRNIVECTMMPDGVTIRLHRCDLPAVADPDLFDVFMDVDGLIDLAVKARARQLGLDADRTGGLE